MPQFTLILGLRGGGSLTVPNNFRIKGGGGATVYDNFRIKGGAEVPKSPIIFS